MNFSEQEFIVVVMSLLGLLLGSFFNVVGLRALKKESIVFPPSHCTSCNHRLSPLDLVPILSYTLLRGKCRYCKDKISYLYPLGEFMTMITFGFLTYKYGLSVEIIPHLILCSCLVILVITDLKEQYIPDTVTFPSVILIALSRTILVKEDLMYYILSSIGIFIVLYLIMIISKDKMGGGDVITYGVIGLGIGITNSVISLFYASFIGLAVMIPLIVINKHKRKEPFPFIPFVYMGVMLTYIIDYNIFL